MRARSHKHTIQLVAALLLIAAMLYATTVSVRLNVLIIAVVSVGYLLINVLNEHRQQQLSAARVAEFGMIALIAEFVALNYLT